MKNLPFIDKVILIVCCLSFVSVFVYYAATGTVAEDGLVVSLLASALFAALVYALLRWLKKKITKKKIGKQRIQHRAKQNQTFKQENVEIPPCRVASKNITPTALSDLRKLKNYVVLDVETTGLSRQSDNIIEIGVLTVADGKPAGEYTQLINPGRPIPQSATAVNGISDADVARCPTMQDVAGDIWAMLDGNIMVGYNASFDAAFVAKEMSRCGADGTIRYVDVLALARRAYPGLDDHKLVTVAKHLGYNGVQSHRSLDDAKLTYFVLNMSIKKILQEHEDERKKKKEEQEYQERLRQEKFSSSPLVNKTVAFTGDFKTDRSQLEEMLEKVGAILKNSVTKKLDYLVVGDVSCLPDWALERKINKANRYIGEGCSIVKLTEGEYLRLIRDALSGMK